MKITLLFISFFYLSFPAIAQDTIAVNVMYEFRHINDLEHPESPYTTNMILSIGKASSRYCSEKLYNENDKKAIEAKRKQQERMAGAPSGTLTAVAGGPLLTIGKQGAIINEQSTCCAYHGCRPWYRPRHG